ncbi:protein STRICTOSIDINE SYNTHASE-LIKE 10 [Manihot esculenta]|uniref:Strictosidine synthase conserved region domain-containing protein n=1 Tax=Manihot esculenta TaxID=3983 RepID=A0A2C9WHH5_MANES|nr:protein STRICTOSIDINE SYNTHASE-LIKE 10 [Manihot esculenta]OAY59321.1 hypothetical protein MANES_01G023500v8 [Manihot esculenta]
MVSIPLQKLLFIFTLTLHPSFILSHYHKQKIIKLHLPPSAAAPEATAFDSAGVGPYTGVDNGRVFKYVNPIVGYVEFATTSPTRPRRLCDANTNREIAPICGRPLGVAFYHTTGHLYIADAYFGLVEVGPQGGIGTTISKSAGGVPYKNLNALDIDQKNGVVYFTDVSSKFQLRQFNEALLSGDQTGRLIKYDIKKKQATVLVHNLGVPVGVAISKHADFVLVSEYLNNRTLKFWLAGDKANTTEIFTKFPGRPDNIKRNAKGEFWIPVTSVNGNTNRQVAWRLDEDGKLKESFDLRLVGNPIPICSEFQEIHPRVFSLGLLNVNYSGFIY